MTATQAPAIREATSTGRWSRLCADSFIEPVLVILSVLLLLQCFSWLGIAPRDTLPPPTAIASALVTDLQNPELWTSLSASLGAWAVGLAIIIALAIPLGTLLGLVPVLYEATNPTLEFVRTIPSVSALPVLMFVYGAGFELTVFLVVFSGVWPLLIHTTRGLHDVDPGLLESARVFGISPRQRLLLVLLPAASPYIVTGLRISAVLGLLMAVGTSLIVGGEGLGELIFSAQRSGNTDLVYARIVLTSLVAVAITFSLLRAERWFLRWHASYRPSGVS